MKSPAIYKCTPKFDSSWQATLQKFGFQFKQDNARVKIMSGRAVIDFIKVENDHVMVVFSAPMVFWGKHLQLAKTIENVFLNGGLICKE
ncbi:MAG: hypothetical protein WCS42_04120 [Verrucomicrobiota bacterium]